LETWLNFLFNNQKKTVQSLAQSGRKAVSKSELPERQFESTVRDKIACRSHLEWENDCFKYI